MSDEDSDSGFELWLHDLSIDPATRVAGAILIILGSALGAMLGVLLMAADPADIMSQIGEDQSSDSVNGIVISSLEDNNTGGDPIEGVLVELLNEDRTSIGSDITDSGGRFSIVDVPRQSSILYVQHSGNYTVEILLVPGDHSQIVVTLEPGDGLAHGVPAWNNHYYVHLNDAVDIPIEGTRESRFLPTAEAIFERIDEIRVLILNSPLNPTGTCFNRDELGAICDVILAENLKRQQSGKKPVMLVYDQVYSTMTAPGIEHIHPVQVRPEIFDYTITLDAISKSLTGTGLRLGWMALPPALAPPVIALIGHMGAWPARPIQKAAAKLYSKPELLDSYFDELDGKIEERMVMLQNVPSLPKAVQI